MSILADEAEELVEGTFPSSTPTPVAGWKAREWREGSDHSAELEQTKQTIDSLREDRALGLFTTREDQEMFRQHMTALVAKRDALAELPIVKAGWVEVETEETYGQVWPSATPEERRTMLVDAGVRLTVHRPNVADVRTDLGRMLGEGPSGEEWLAQEEARAAEERARHGVPS